MNIKKIGVPLDFSELSREQVDYAIEIAKPFQAKILLVNITQIVQMAEVLGALEGGLPAIIEPELIKQVKESAQEQLAKHKKQAEDAGVEVESYALTGTISWRLPASRKTRKRT